jgi:hypothetical protein
MHRLARIVAGQCFDQAPSSHNVFADNVIVDDIIHAFPSWEPSAAF